MILCTLVILSAYRTATDRKKLFTNLLKTRLSIYLNKIVNLHGKVELLVTDVTEQARKLAQKWFSRGAKLIVVDI